MSDWDIVKSFIMDKGYTPQNISMDSYIACMILHYEGDLENEGITEDDLPLAEWLNEHIGMNYRMEDFDYE